MQKPLFLLIMKRLICLWLLISPLSSKAQDIVCYNYLVAKAEYEIFKGQHAKAIVSLEQAEAMPFTHQGLIYQYLFTAYCATAKHDLALKSLEKMVLKGGSDEYLKNTIASTDFKTKPQWQQFNKEIDSLKRVFKSNLDLEYLGEVVVLFGADQLVRSSVFKDDKKKRAAADSLNFITFEKLVRKKGIPGKNTPFGMFGSTKFLALLLHFSFVNKKSWEFVQTTIKEMYDQGIMHAGTYALIIDRYHSWLRIDGKPGSQQFGQWDLDPGSNFVELSTIDERRTALGLLPLQYFAEMRNKELPSGYQLSKNYILGTYSGCK